MGLAISLALAVIFFGLTVATLWAQNAPKSLIPPARPPAAASQPARPQPPASPAFKVEDYVETDAQKYFSKDDPDNWPLAVRDFALRVKFEFDAFRDLAAFRLDYELTEIYDYVDERLNAIIDNQTELTRYDEDNLEMAYIEEFLRQNLEGLAIDECGLYYLMYQEENPETAQWLKTSINAHAPPSGGAPYQKDAFGEALNGPGPAKVNENNARRFGAAMEAWRREPSE
jgi:hypothetical protein